MVVRVQKFTPHREGGYELLDKLLREIPLCLIDFEMRSEYELQEGLKDPKKLRVT